MCYNVQAAGKGAAAEMDDTFLRTMLFDFYGDLLTAKQREYYDLHYNSDLSLQEIADDCGATRQAVWDIVRRAEQSLREYEEKTGLIAKALRRRAQIGEIAAIAEALPDSEAKRQILEKLKLLDD